MIERHVGIYSLLLGLFLLYGCNNSDYEAFISVNHEPPIEPNYSGITIPRNIAPMNFHLLDDADKHKIKVSVSGVKQFHTKSNHGVVRFPSRKWKKILSESCGRKIAFEVYSKKRGEPVKKYDAFYMHVANEPIDPYVSYRLLYPGYESFGKMRIIQRSTECFSESSLFENQLLEDNCVNCHTFLKHEPNRFFLHVRGTKAGTYFVDNKGITRKELKTGIMPGNAVYPSWHPSGKYVAFSSNKIFSIIHMLPGNHTELYETSSMMVLYHIEKNEMSPCGATDSVKFIETFPFWSPDGKFLYYCRTCPLRPGFDLKQVKYNLVRRSFEQESGIFGDVEVIFDARSINMSVSFPSISPNGNYLSFALQDYGTFPSWHKEADLYLLNLKNEKIGKMSLNSNESESYHAWSSNGKWLVFSSKREDGITARLYFAYFLSPDSIGKPFVLPQRDPKLYDRMGMAFNKPEFIKGKVNSEPRDFEKASKKEPVQAIWVE